MKDNLYKIQDFKRIDPFLISINSADNHWMYISSTGCLTAGREQAKHALFPYVTDDLLHQNARYTGPSTHILVKQNNKKYLWQPFSDQIEPYKKENNLYKNSLGNKIVFEETNHSLGLTFLYSWQASSRYGFVKKTKLINHSEVKLNVKLIDGLRNILPAGLELRIQQEMSNLANAYKVSECNPDYNYALYYMNALLMDKPDPGESLFSNMVWSFSEEKFELSVNQKSINTFLNDQCFTSDLLIKKIAVDYLRVIAFLFPFIAIGLTIGRILQGIGLGMPSLIITTIRVIGVAGPLAYYFVYIDNKPLEWMWYAMFISGIIATIISVIWLLYAFRKFLVAKPT